MNTSTQQNPLRPRATSRKLEYPVTMSQAEPLVVSLRHGVAELLGMGAMLIDRRIPGEPHSLMQLMEEVCNEVHRSEYQEFPLSNGARIMQEMFGPSTDHDLNVYLQARIRAVCVVMSCLERVGLYRYQSQPFRLEGDRDAEIAARRRAKHRRKRDKKPGVPGRPPRAGGPQAGSAPDAAGVVDDEGSADAEPSPGTDAGD